MSVVVPTIQFSELFIVILGCSNVCLCPWLLPSVLWTSSSFDLHFFFFFYKNKNITRLCARLAAQEKCEIEHATQRQGVITFPPDQGQRGMQWEG